ncbi:DUF4931 domain-containing protein [Candidatus Micrarchaeota archaeon]|nr:DUF4931 domain-containing protein [Candidatus Micrarchaeota archaeon]
MNEFVVDSSKDAVIISAPKRAKRPKITHGEKKPNPFAKGNEKMTPETTHALPNVKNWRVRCFENAFPIVSPKQKAFGHHEVIVETPKETELFQDYSKEQCLLVFKAWKNRFSELSKKKGVRSVFLFKNHGKLAGASIPHEHSQIIALPFLPSLIESEYAHFDLHPGFYDSLLKDAVLENKFFALVPAKYGRFPHEFWVISKKKKRNLLELSDEEGLALVQLLQKGVSKLWSFCQDYIFAFHQRIDGDFRLHVEVYPRSNVWAGLEYGAGVIVRSTSTKQTRKLLK